MAMFAHRRNLGLSGIDFKRITSTSKVKFRVLGRHRAVGVPGASKKNFGRAKSELIYQYWTDLHVN
jgi:hypothetical protein